MAYLFIAICNSSPATDGDLLDSEVSVSLVHPSCSGVVLSTQVYPDLCGMHHLLQGRIVVEVIIAWSHVWLWGQQTECDVTSREGHVTGTQEAYTCMKQILRENYCLVIMLENIFIFREIVVSI